MSDGMVRKWARVFNEGRENVHDEARSGRPSFVNDNLVRKVNERVRDDRRFTISDLSLHFPHISRTILSDIASGHLGRRRPHSMRRVHENMCPATISESIIAANTWKNSLKNAESDNNKILYETLIDFFTAKRYLLSEQASYNPAVGWSAHTREYCTAYDYICPCPCLPPIYNLFHISLGITHPGRGSTVVKVLCYKSEGRWFDPSWCQWIFH